VHRLKPGLAFCAITALAAAALALGPQAAAARQAGARVPLRGTLPSWASQPRRLAEVRTGAVRVTVYLAGRDQAGLTAYATAVSTPGGASYRTFLSPAQVMRRFGPAPSQVRAVSAWLTTSGLHVTAIRARHAAGAFIAAAGPVAAASRAFGVTFASYRGPGGRPDRAPSAVATIPASVAGSVLAVTGLDTARHLLRPAMTRSPAARPAAAGAKLPPPGPNSWPAPPCSRYYAQRIAYGKPRAAGRRQPWGLCGYRPAQLRGAYSVTPTGMTGAGQTVAIVDVYQSPTIRADADRYAKLTGGRPFRPGQYRQYRAGTFSQAGPKLCNAPHWYGEQTLDVEALHGMAPDADVRYVAAANCSNSGFANALALVVNRRLASIVSDSWSGLADSFGTKALFGAIFRLGAAEGIGFYFSTGDHGYNAPQENPQSNKIQVSYPPADPWVTAVGGTSLAVGKRREYEFETAWGSLADRLSKNGRNWSSRPPGRYPADYNGSGGGGVSISYRQPFYQRGVVPLRLATHLPDGTVSRRPMRVIPDLAADADPGTGMLVGQTTLQPDGKSYAFSLSVVGGTSLACPVIAGIQADAQQAAGHRFGFANPLIYARHRTRAFHDVTGHPLGARQLYQVLNAFARPAVRRGPVVTFLTPLGINGGGSAALRAVRGYDDATGVGSPARYVQSFSH
jgi:subtilase family serine protease